MASFLILLFISVCTIARVLGAPQRSQLSIRQALTSSSSGTNNGYYYQYWSDSAPGPEAVLGSGGSYSVTWSGGEYPFLVGKGWNPGSAQAINYTGSFTPESGTAYLSIYGWTTGPLVEYHILESYSTFNPSADQYYLYRGNITSDGGTYDIYTREAPYEGLFPQDAFKQFYSVRTEKRVAGTVTTANHFDAWEAAGMVIGTFNYQIVAIEGTDGSGSASITAL